MAFASGPVTFQRFYLAGQMPAATDGELLSALERRAFGAVAPLPDDTQHGWIGPRHLMDTQFAPEHLIFGSYVHLGLRVDALRPPSSIVKAYVRMEEQATLEATGRPFLSKGERKRAKDAAVERADAEARDGQFRRISSYPVLVDLAGGAVFFGASGAALGDRLALLFGETFGCSLESADPARLAERCGAALRVSRAVENLAPLRLADPPQGYSADAGGSFERDLSFLGKELLSWLWFRSDASEGALRVRGGDDVTLILDRMLRLKCDFGMTGADVMTADGVTSLPEARVALRTGKQPVKAGLVVGAPVGEFKFTLDALRMVVSALQLPEPQENDPRARLEARFEHVSAVGELLDAVFEMFLQRRTSAEWDAELAQMRAWAAGRPLQQRLRAAATG